VSEPVGGESAPGPDHAPSAGPAALVRRHELMRALRGFFDTAGFTEVETPLVVRSPGLELHIEAFEVTGLLGTRWLQTSPEYHMKRLLAAGMRRIYQVCKTFRREEQGAFHQPEFTMLEWYRADAGMDEMMRDTEALVAHVAHAVLGTTRIPGAGGHGSEIDVAPPWERLTVRAAFERHATRPYDALLADEESFYRTLIDEVEPRLGAERPTLLTHYPASMAALARLCPDDPSVAERFETYVGGVELCNGFGELVDPGEQRARLRAEAARRASLGKPAYPIDERFLDALEHGVPPSGGNALGVDRLLMLLLGARDIAEVVAFSAERV
jgi:elongation factor P--(R)-beta-lysine ligase